MSARRLPRAAVAAAFLLASPLAACGSEDDGAATGSDDAGSGDTPAAEAFEPVTIEHAFGSTEIDERPQRVVTWGWGSRDAAIALKGFARCDATAANLFWIGLTTCPIQDNP